MYIDATEALPYLRPGPPPRRLRGSLQVPIFGTALFLFSAGFPPLDGVAEVNLVVHMTQHVLIILAGVAIAYPAIGRGLLVTPSRKLFPTLALLSATSLLIFWHIPLAWDGAVLDPWLHAVEHLSFLGIGALSGSWILGLSDSKRMWALMAAFFGHMAYAGVLVSPSSGQVYSLYTVADQGLLGWVLLLTGPTLLVGVAYLVVRNPRVLAGFGAATTTSRATGGVKIPTWAAPVLTIALVAIAAAYFAGTVLALTFPADVPGGGAVVTIIETPISWQFSPQNIRTIHGINSTVTWVSRSLSFDSVVDRGGMFSSGAIGPGQTYTHSFTTPGVYEYYCSYHPWMVGTVTVVP